MKKINYDELLEGKEREMYEALIAALEPHCNTNVGWDLSGGEFFDISVASVDISLFGKSDYRHLGISVIYTPLNKKFTVKGHGEEMVTDDVNAIVAYVKENALKKAV